MNYNELNGPKMTGEQIAAYLSRVGMEGPVELTWEGLTRIQKAHQRTVPFENLDILAGRPLSLRHEALYDKIVLHRRGGVCAELNTLYNWLLYSLGFEVTSYNSRIASQGDIQFRRHRVLGVKLEGKTYTTDVGFTTENARCPLLLEAGLVQSDGACEYRYERDAFYGWLLFQKKPGEDWQKALGFTEEPQIDLDFDTPMFYYEKHPDSNMNKVPRVSLYTEDGIIAIRASGGPTCTKKLVEKAGILQSAEEIPTREEENRLIQELFHLPTEGL